MKKLAIWAVVLVIAFAAGYVPEHLKLEDLRQQSRETRERLESRIAEVEADYRVSRIHGQLGMLILETEQQNFATALKRSSELFDAIGEAIPMTKDMASRTALVELSKQRDSVTSALAMASPEAVSRLKQLYVDFEKVSLAG